MTVPNRVQCCIAGGGPAGLMLGYLLARAGVTVAILEKHADFLRDFRGDTVHPSTLDIMDDLGLLDRFLLLPHQKVDRLAGQFGDKRYELADFRHLPVRAPFIAMMPQWDFLNFLAEEGARYPGFHLLMEAEATDLITEGDHVKGLRLTTSDGAKTIEADLVVGADGRGSILRERAGLHIENLGAPMDALWFRLPRDGTDPADTMGRFDRGRIFVMINRGDYWQIAYVIPKGSLEDLRAKGLDAFREDVVAAAPFTASHVGEIKSWDDVKLLEVRVDRLTNWYKPGLLCIGDAAHAMSPIGGVGINLAIQDAVAAANLLAQPLLEKRLTEQDLRAVQKRRELPTRILQRAQVTAQTNIIAPALSGTEEVRAPWPLRLFDRFPLLRRLPARFMGLGIRREHVSEFIRDR
jgi:2-polyprenyl-6-methoxyphenol hydroxylase-like FAD-dependent oxidoreductase